MIVESLLLQNFRNIEAMEICPSPGINVIYGKNAQGKTNLLESIWLFTGLKPFRGAKDKEMVQFGKAEARIFMKYFNDSRQQTAEIRIGNTKRAEIGKIPCKSNTELVGNFLGSIFLPENLDLVQSGPSERRRFINQALCQLKPKYSENLSSFNRIILQRNTLLKDIPFHRELEDTLEIWDEKMADISAAIIIERVSYIKNMTPFICDFYSGISGGREEMEIQYEPSFKLEGKNKSEIKEEILRNLTLKRKEDISAGYTTVGPHRDDIGIFLNGIPVKNFGSQGQQRSCALSLKMSEAAMIREISGKQPVILLDDVMSELDSGRQDYILNHIENWQVFITCCEPNSIFYSKKSDAVGKMFEIKEGKICSST